MSNPSLRRRTWLGLGLASGAALALAGWGLAAAPSGPALAPTGALSPAVQVMLRTLGGAVLDGSLPSEPAAHAQALDGLLVRIPGVVVALPPHAQAELGQLLTVLAHPWGRRALAGLAPDWAEASVADVTAALNAMRSSSLAPRQQAYHGLREVIAGAYFADPATWAVLRYPGPRSLSQGVA